MHDYLLGLVTIPAVLVAAMVLLLAVRSVWGVCRMVGTRIGPETSDQQRARHAAWVYAGTRVRLIAKGDFALIAVFGQRPDDRRRAYDALHPARSYESLRPPRALR